jgi:hypothetical protein
MCARVARHPVEWSLVVLVSNGHQMQKEIPQSFARRARLSSKAILTAIALTLAALTAIAIASREETATTVKTFGPVTHVPVTNKSMLVPVFDR